MKPTLLILAAGLWSRYGGGVLKQMDVFWPNHETLLEYSVYDAVRAGFGKVVFVIRKEFADTFKKTIGSKFAHKIEVAYVYQEMTSYVPTGMDITHRTKPRWTWHAVLVAKNEINTPFAVINADDYYGVNAYQQMCESLQTIQWSKECSMVGYVLKNTLSPFGSVNRGICHVNEKRELVAVSEWLKLSRGKDGVIRDMHDRIANENSIVSMNFRWFSPSIFNHIEQLFLLFLEKQGMDPTYEFFIPTVVNNFIHEGGTCKVMVSKDNRCGVTNPEDKQYVQETLSWLIEYWVYKTPLF